MLFRSKKNHFVTVDADFIETTQSAAIIFDGGPMRVVPKEQFDREWELVGESSLSAVVYIDRLLAVAKAANKLLSPPYNRLGGIVMPGEKPEDWRALDDALTTAGIEGERYC